MKDGMVYSYCAQKNVEKMEASNFNSWKSAKYNYYPVNTKFLFKLLNLCGLQEESKHVSKLGTAQCQLVFFFFFLPGSLLFSQKEVS